MPIFKLAAALGAAGLLNFPVHAHDPLEPQPPAPIVVDPHTGASGSFSWAWYPAYPSDNSLFTTWNLTARRDQQIVFRLRDESYPGDNFSHAVLNGTVVPWDTYVAGTGDRYGGTYADGRVTLSLAAGQTYTLGFDATPCGHNSCDFGGGGTYWITPVPEPGTYALFAGGIATLAWRRFKSRA